MILLAYLAGLSFVIAVVALGIAVAEHYRADRAEQVLLDVQATLGAAIRAQGEDLTRLARQGVALAEQDVRLNRLIQAVAAASVPPAIPCRSSAHRCPRPEDGTMTLQQALRTMFRIDVAYSDQGIDPRDNDRRDGWKRCLWEWLERR